MSAFKYLLLYILVLTPGFASHVILWFSPDHPSIEFRFIVAGFMFDLAWGTLLFLFIRLTSKYKKFFSAITILIFITINIWGISNVLHFDYLSIFIPYQSLIEFWEFQDVGPDYFFAGVKQSKMIIGFIIPLFLFVVVYLLERPRRITLKEIFMLIFIIILSHGYANNNSKGSLYDSRVSSIYNFAFFSRNQTKLAEQVIPTSEDLVLLKKALGKPSDSLDPHFPLFEKVSHEKAVFSELGKTPNIIIIALESVRRACIQKSTMPFLYDFRENSLYFENYFSPVRYTQRAHFSILHSTITGPAESTADIQEQYPNLPEILNNYGYTSYQFDASRPVPQKVYFYKKNGNLDITFAHDMADYLGIGAKEILNDEELYDFTSKKIKELPKPYLLLLATMSTHGPFYFPKSTLTITDSNEKQAYAYADRAIEKFVERFQKDTVFENTLLVITSDTATGCRYVKHDSQYELLTESLRVPLYMYFQGLTEFKTIEIVGAHPDIAPSILEILGFSYSSSFLGKSLFAEERYDRVILFNKLRYRGLINNDCIYYQSKEMDEKIFCPQERGMDGGIDFFRMIEGSFSTINYLQNVNRGRWVN